MPVVEKVLEKSRRKIHLKWMLVFLEWDRLSSGDLVDSMFSNCDGNKEFTKGCMLSLLCLLTAATNLQSKSCVKGAWKYNQYLVEAGNGWCKNFLQPRVGQHHPECHDEAQVVEETSCSFHSWVSYKTLSCWISCIELLLPLADYSKHTAGPPYCWIKKILVLQSWFSWSLSKSMDMRMRWGLEGAVGRKCSKLFMWQNIAF